MVDGLELNVSLRTISVQNDLSPNRGRQNRDKTDEGKKEHLLQTLQNLVVLKANLVGRRHFKSFIVSSPKLPVPPALGDELIELFLKTQRI